MHAALIEDRLLWNRFVACNPTGHICQTYEWADHPGTEALRIGVLEGDQLLAAALLVRNSVGSLPASFYYAPRGPVCADPASPALNELLDFARWQGRRHGAFLIRSEPNVAEDDTSWSRVLRESRMRPTRHTTYRRSAWVTDLQPSEECILANMMSSWRYNIQAGKRRGVVIHQGTTEADLDAFYRLLIETGQRDRFYVYSKDHFREMLDNYSPERAARDGTAEMALFLAEYEGEPIAAATVAVLGEWSWNLHSGQSGQREHMRLRPNYPLQWACMRWCKDHGARSYDWRTIPDVLRPGEELYGVYEFKRGFGGSVRRVLPTQDLVLRPALYWPYVAAVTARHYWQERQRRGFERGRGTGRPEAQRHPQAPATTAGDQGELRPAAS